MTLTSVNLNGYPRWLKKLGDMQRWAKLMDLSALKLFLWKWLTSTDDGMSKRWSWPGSVVLTMLWNLPRRRVLWRGGGNLVQETQHGWGQVCLADVRRSFASDQGKHLKNHLWWLEMLVENWEVDHQTGWIGTVLLVKLLQSQVGEWMFWVPKWWPCGDVYC